MDDRVDKGLAIIRAATVGVILLGTILIPLALRDPHVIEGEIARQVNLQREAQGFGYVVYDERLSDAARDYSEDMLARGFFGHSSAYSRIERLGGDALALRRAYGDTLGENIVWTSVGPYTPGCGVTLTNRQIADCMLEAWRASPPHITLILEQDDVAHGVGVACDSSVCKGTEYLSIRNAA